MDYYNSKKSRGRKRENKHCKKNWKSHVRARLFNSEWEDFEQYTPTRYGMMKVKEKFKKVNPGLCIYCQNYNCSAIVWEKIMLMFTGMKEATLFAKLSKHLISLIAKHVWQSKTSQCYVISHDSDFDRRLDYSILLNYIHPYERPGRRFQPKTNNDNPNSKSDKEY